MNVSEIEQAMLALDQRDLAALAQRGIQAFAETESGATRTEVDAAWNAELRRPLDDVESGRTELLTADDVDTRVDELLTTP